jgi:hypothetical protein
MNITNQNMSNALSNILTMCTDLYDILHSETVEVQLAKSACQSIAAAVNTLRLITEQVGE